MAVIVKYVVERNGVEMVPHFTSKAEADNYDKMLDMAENLSVLISESDLISDEDTKESLSIFLAERREEILVALGVKRKAPKKASKKTESKEESEKQEEEVK